MCCVTWRRSMVEIAAAIQVPGFQTRYVKVVLLLAKFIARYPPKIWDFAFINTDPNPMCSFKNAKKTFLEKGV